MNVTTRIITALVFAMTSLPSNATAQILFDHMKCYKVKDSANFTADVALNTLQPEFGPGLELCKVKGKAKFVCGPAEKFAVFNFKDKSEEQFGQVTLDGVDLSFDRICYKMKCPTPGPVSLLMTDQFGTRNLEKFKAQLVCTPAVKGGPQSTTTTTSSTTSTTTSTTSSTTTSTTTTTTIITCSDGIQNQDETDVDCGGSVCPACPDFAGCLTNPDCQSLICDVVTSTCQAPSCTDAVQNQDETDVDCGGVVCPPCDP